MKTTCYLEWLGNLYVIAFLTSYRICVGNEMRNEPTSFILEFNGITFIFYKQMKTVFFEIRTHDGHFSNGVTQKWLRNAFFYDQSVGRGRIHRDDRCQVQFSRCVRDVLCSLPGNVQSLYGRG